MYAVPSDCVITYDSNFLQEHIDSSDFEEFCTPLVKIKKGNHNLVETKKNKMTRRNHPQPHSDNSAHLYTDCDEYPVKLKPENILIPKETRGKYNKKRDRKSNNREYIDLNRGDQIGPVQSKLSIFKHKVIPCISSMFRRSHCTKHNMSAIEENQNENKCSDSRCQYCNNCEQSHMRKLYTRQQNYVVQPVYAIEGNAHRTTTGPFAPTKITEKPLQHHNRKTKNQYSSNCSLSSSSESDSHCTQERRQKVDMFRKRLKNEIIKEHMKYQQNLHITQQVQYPSKDNKYQVFTTPMQSRNQPQNYYDRCITNIPSSSSSFWEYLYDKTTTNCAKKYQTHRAEVPPHICPATLQANQTTPCGTCSPKKDQRDFGSHGDLSGKGRATCKCKQKNVQQQTQPSPIISEKPSCDPLCTSPSLQKKCNPNCSYDTIGKSSTTAPESKKKKQKVKCKCTDKSKHQKGRTASKETIDQLVGGKKYQDTQKHDSGNQETSLKPCQEGHDDIVSSLAQKYNGEVLCIHNPPCILINGCLNLPPQKDQRQQNNDMSFWPVTEDRKNNFYDQTEITNREQSCQYHVEVNKAVNYRVEKKVQSICHHKPPCEVVRGCQRKKYDPQLENSCVHVPMCKQMPECVVTDRKKTCCDHRPRCRDIPICSKDFVILTARENIGTQVTAVLSSEKDNFICRHEPPCIMIPKCIGKAVCDSSYVNVDAIPGCLHQPSCELIPACCRKLAKEMVSVSSQYPNSCRIV